MAKIHWEDIPDLENTSRFHASLSSPWFAATAALAAVIAGYFLGR